MGRELYMLGLTVQNMDEALTFYRRLGLAVPDEPDNQQHVEVKMNGGLTFFLDTRPVRRGDPAEAEALGAYRVLLEFYLPSRAEVEAKYAELTGLGYKSYRAPFETTFGMVFALVDDPDGNTILLSADATPAT
jgi:catechol 2,3-dioxygenase-like lactoylglutathione lyase family enzyme